MADTEPTWNLSEPEWTQLLERVRSESDVLEDGAYVRYAANPAQSSPELRFYAAPFNKPANWQYPFDEEIAGAKERGALVGLAWHEAETGFVQFEVSLIAAVRTLSADYESGVSDLDYVAYETAFERAVRGTPADLAWLHREFSRLVGLVK